MMRFLYLGFAIFSLALFGMFEYRGITLTRPETAKNVQLASNTVRHNPGSRRRSHYHAVFVRHK